MALERRNPLPAGKYWIDVFGDNRDKFDLFRKAEQVHTDATQSFDSEPPRNWYLFTVKAPIQFDQKTFGFPTIATPDVKSADDTIQKPDLPKNALDDLDKTLTQLGMFAKLGLGILALGLIAKGLRK